MDAMVVLKATLLLGLTLVAARCLSGSPAVTRHRLWSLAFAALLALPFLAVAVPDVPIVAPPSWTRAAASLASGDPVARGIQSGEPVVTSSTMAPNHRAPTVESSPPASAATQSARSPLSTVLRRLTVSTVLLGVWLLGAVAASGALMLSLMRVKRLARTAEDLDDAAWREAADAMSMRLGLRRPVRLLVSGGVTTPMAGGIWTPAVFLPTAARAWSADRRDIVLAHEIAHLAGRDPLRHLVARLAVAAYWFHPLAWIAAKQAAITREQACDETVLALGTRPSTYARVLLDLAETMHAPAPAAGVLPMVEPSLLEKRLMAILSNDGRLAAGRTVTIPAIAVALLTLAVAAAEPVRSRAASSTALPLDRSGSDAVQGGLDGGTAAALFASQSARVKSQADVPRDSACWWEFGSSFSGSMSTSGSGGGSVIHEQVGTRGADRVIQKSFGDLRLCMLAVDVGAVDDDERPSHWPGRASRVVIEARRGGSDGNVQRLEIGSQTGAGQRVSWRVGGAERAFDDTAERWRERMLAVFDATWELSRLRGHVSSLHGEISSIRGEESSLRGEISSLQGEVSSMRGQASSIRGEESSLRGEISSIEGHLSSLRGKISSERGQISAGYRVDEATRSKVAELIRGHEAEIERVEREIRDYDAAAKVAAVERQIAALDASGEVAKIEAQIRAFDIDGKIATVERRIGALDVDGKVAAIEREIKALDVDVRSRKLEDQRAAELKQLEAIIKALDR
jgi:beta-lactamase regulating signal transducer with metallopeptidase domain